MPGEELKVIATSCDAYPGLIGTNAPIFKLWQSGKACGTTPSGPISIVFNRPIKIQELAKSTLEAYDMAQPDASAKPYKKVSSPLKIALTAGDAVLTLTPETPLVENYLYQPVSMNSLQITYTMQGKLISIKPEDLYLQGLHLPIAWYIYVVPATPFDINAIALDDLNGSLANGSSSNTSTEVNIKLPAAASGKVTITKYSVGGGATAYELDGQVKDGISYQPVTIEILGCLMVADHMGENTRPDLLCDAKNSCGTDNTVRCISPLFAVGDKILPKDENKLKTGDKMTITFALTDSLGNPITGTRELTIQ